MCTPPRPAPAPRRAEGARLTRSLLPAAREQFEEIIGTGSFKTVYRGLDTEEAVGVAWNQLKARRALRGRGEYARLV